MAVDVRDLLLLTRIPGVGPARLRALVSHFGDSSSVARAGARELSRIPEIDRRTAQSIAAFFRRGTTADEEHFVDSQLSRLNRVEGTIVSFWDPRYPANLKTIYDPPPLLFIRGELRDEDSCSIGIVGTRAPSEYGQTQAEAFAAGFARLGIPVISGLARGIDTAAHSACLGEGGRTLAVIGSGIDVIYPPENRRLVERLIPGGALISEYPMGTKPDAGNFPRRNRIISGIALGTVVIETGIDGGAMITAATAFDQNREVFAIPSAICPGRPSGTNRLIRQGKAHLTEAVEDVLSELAPKLKNLLTTSPSRTRPLPALNFFEQQIADVLSERPLHVDVIAAQTALPMSDVLAHLLSLEVKGVVRQRPGKLFLRA